MIVPYSQQFVDKQGKSIVIRRASIAGIAGKADGSCCLCYNMPARLPLYFYYHYLFSALSLTLSFPLLQKTN
jgi:hypothetical protein